MARAPRSRSSTREREEFCATLVCGDDSFRETAVKGTPVGARHGLLLDNRRNRAYRYSSQQHVDTQGASARSPRWDLYIHM